MTKKFRKNKPINVITSLARMFNTDVDVFSGHVCHTLSSENEEF